MPEKPKVAGDEKPDLITSNVVKQTLVMLGAAVSLGVVILPLVLSRLWDRLDEINIHTTEIAKLTVEVTQIRRDMDRLMNLIDSNYHKGRATYTTATLEELFPCQNGYLLYSNTPQESQPLLLLGEQAKSSP